MNKIEKILVTIIMIGVAWMAIKTTYGIGRAKGYEQARIECEQNINQLENRCDELIEDGKDEILEQF